MKVKLVGSATAGAAEMQFLTSLVVNDAVAVDAGCLGFAGEPKEQARIQHVLLSHTHIDHLASLPILIENVYSPDNCVTIHGSDTVIKSLREDIFNDRIWPDFFRLSPVDAPFFRVSSLRPGRVAEIEDLKVTPIEVNHGLPTCGFIIESKDSAIVVASDTAPTDEIWERANRTPKLKGVFLDASFPNSMLWLAEASHHLTPSLFAGEIKKLKQKPQIFAVHIKARYRQQVVAELKALNIPKLVITVPGKEYKL